jgi:hypothetical protein
MLASECSLASGMNSTLTNNPSFQICLLTTETWNWYSEAMQKSPGQAEGSNVAEPPRMEIQSWNIDPFPTIETRGRTTPRSIECARQYASSVSK